MSDALYLIRTVKWCFRIVWLAMVDKEETDSSDLHIELLNL